MKKTLLFAALAAMTMGASAQTWNFSEWTAESITETKTVNGLKVYATVDFPVVIDANSKTVDGVSYTQRIKSGGKSQLDSVTNAPLARIYEFPVSGPGSVSVVMTSSSGTGTGRFVKFVVGTDTVYSQEAPVKDPVASPIGVEKYTFEYTGAAGEMQLFFTGGINLYMVSYTASGVVDPDPVDPDPVDPDPVNPDPVDPVVPTGWNFNAANVAVNTYSADFTEGIYTFVCGGKTWQVDANNCRFAPDSTVVYPQRIKAKSKSCQISIAAPSAGTLTFGVRTGSNSDVTRSLVVTQNGTEIYNQLILESDTLAHEAGAPRAYNVHTVAVPAAGTVVVTMPTGNLNFYFITFDDGSGVEQVINLDKLFMSNNVVVANGATKVYVYDMVGKLVATANASEVDLNNAAHGIYVVKAVYADGKTATLKVCR